MDIQRADPEQAPRLKRLTLTPEYIRANEVYVTIEDSALGTGGEIIGFYALTHHVDVCELDHLWVIPERIGTGVGHALFAHALQRARAAGANLMVW